MPPSLGDRLAHIINSIEGVRLILSGLSGADLAADRIRRLALERELEIICEASLRAGRIKAQELSIDWQRMIDLGNRLRHAYHTIELDILHVAQADLPALKGFIERVLARESK